MLRSPCPSFTAKRLAAAAAPLVVAAIVAGCGGSASGSSATVGSASRPLPAVMQRDVVRFAACMRSHGVSDLPDPTTAPASFKHALGQSSSSPAFKPAESACQHFLPNGGQVNQSPARTQAQTAALLAFARCLRSHGFPNFPDPTSSGQLSHQMLASAGIDLQQPALLHAADTCVSVTHGMITRAMVARFVAGH